MADGRPTIAGKAVVSPKVNGTPATASSMQNPKKVKGKRPEEPVDNAKLVQQAISQIESKQAGDREQDLEIGTYWKCSRMMFSKLSNLYTIYNVFTVGLFVNFGLHRTRSQKNHARNVSRAKDVRES
jgi:hypothetical protein